MNFIEIPSKVKVGKKYKNTEFDPQEIIIHAHGEYIDDNGKIYSAVDWQDKLGTSCHFYVTPEGEIISSVPIDEIAWHARGVNLSSIGIEVLVPGEHNYGTFLEAIKGNWVSDAQLNAVIWLVDWLFRELDIDEVRRHSDQAPGRKKDPGEGFPWEELLAAVGL